jgi:hypothetical protein
MSEFKTFTFGRASRPIIDYSFRPSVRDPKPGPKPSTGDLGMSELKIPEGLVGHDDYGKRVLHAATKGHAVLCGASVEIHYGTGQPARIDATVGDIAVEVESRVSKQVRGAVLDLICHQYPKKLLLLLPVHMNNSRVTASSVSTS